MSYTNLYSTGEVKIQNNKKINELFTMNKVESELLKLKNLGSASVNILHAVGINSYDDLKQTGPVEVYLRIKARDIHVSKVMLYALQGALLDMHWNDLEPGLKQRLVTEAGES